MRRRFFVSVTSALVCALAAANASPAAARTSFPNDAMTAYVEAIRYFNPGIAEPEAERIVVAIVRDATSAGIDPRLVVAVVATESSFDRTARSSSGAMGLGQLMPGTAADDGVSNADDIDQNIRGTVLTLSGNLRHYARYDQQHQYLYAIAAYNAGSGAVDEYGGIPPYDETVHYVMKVVVLWRRLSGLSAT